MSYKMTGRTWTAFLLCMMLFLLKLLMWQGTLLKDRLEVPMETANQHGSSSKREWTQWTTIPKIIHVSRMGDQSCKSKNQRWEYHILQEEDEHKLLHETKIELSSLQRKVELYDIWRYWEVNRSGGFYFDSDVECLEPILDWETFFKGYLSANEKVDMIIGVEFGVNVFNSVQFLQWQFASTPNNPILQEVLKEIKIRLRDGIDHLNENNADPTQVIRRETLLRTGPAVWSTVILAYIEKYASPPGVVEVDGKPHPKALRSPNDLAHAGQFLQLSRPEEDEKLGLLILPYVAWGCRTVRKWWFWREIQCPNVASSPSEFPLRHLSFHRSDGSWKS